VASEAFVNSVHLVFGSLLGLVDKSQYADNYGVVDGVFFAVFVDGGCQESERAGKGGCDNRGESCVHFKSVSP
jgi:hypothetical protein